MGKLYANLYVKLFNSICLLNLVAIVNLSKQLHPKRYFIDSCHISIFGSLSSYVSVSIVHLLSDTVKGDALHCQDTLELMDLSQASKLQLNLASNRTNNKGNQFKRDSPSSSFGPRDEKGKGSKRLTSHLIYTATSIHHPWQL